MTSLCSIKLHVNSFCIAVLYSTNLAQAHHSALQEHQITQGVRFFVCFIYQPPLTTPSDQKGAVKTILSEAVGSSPPPSLSLANSLKFWPHVPMRHDGPVVPSLAPKIKVERTKGPAKGHLDLDINHPFLICFLSLLWSRPRQHICNKTVLLSTGLNDSVKPIV